MIEGTSRFVPTGTEGEGWLGRAVRPAPAEIPWPAVVRAAVAIGAMTAVGIATSNPGAGLLAALGALCGVLQNTAGPYRLRVLNIAVPMVLGAGGLVMGEAAFGHGWWTVLVLVLVALVSGLISPIGAISSSSGLMLLLMAVLGASLPLPGPWWAPPLYYLGGAAFFLGLVLLAWPMRTLDPERQAVAEVYYAIAAVIDGTPHETELSPIVTTAQDVLLRHRLGEQGRDSEVHWLITMLNAASPLLEATTVLSRAGEPIPPRIAQAVRRIGDAVLAGERTCALPELEGDPALVSAVAYAHRRLAGPRGEEPDLLGRPAAWPKRLADAVRTVLTTPATWRYGLRLALCIGIAAVLTAVIDVPRSYWIMITVTFVLKPDFGSVFVRAVLRGLGTLVGVAIAALLLLAVPRGWPAVPIAAFCGGLVPLVAVRSYAMQTAAITPLVLVLVDLLHHESAGSLTGARLADTAIGCAIVLVFGYVLWPESWRARLGTRFADTVEATAAYLAGGFTSPADESSRARRALHRRITTLRTTLQQAMSEPPPASRKAAAWWPAVVALEDLVGAITATTVQTRHGARSPEPGQVHQAAAVLESLAAGIRAGDPPGPLPALPGTSALGDVIPEIRSFHATLPS